MSTIVFVDPEISTQVDGAQSSRVPVSLPKDPYRHAYLVGMDTESEPFEGEAETPESPHIVAPPTCCVQERVLACPVIARMAVHVPPAMSPGLSAGIAEVAAMSDSAFRKRFRSSYDRSHRQPFQSRRGIEIWESRVVVLDDEGHSVESDGFGLGQEEEAVPEGQQREVSVVREVVSEPLGLGTFEVGQGSKSAPEPERSKSVSASWQPTLTTWKDREGGMVYIDVHAYPPPAPPVQTPPSPEWSSGSFLISPAPYIVLSPIPSPMISLTVPSHIASHVATLTATILVNKDQFIEVGAQLELYKIILQDHTQRLDAMPPALFAEIDRDAALQRELQEMRRRVTALDRKWTVGSGR
nr:hypothetical protein [Tanacetum cinerariifolium]